MVSLAIRVRLVQEGMLARKDLQEHKDHRDHREMTVREVLRDLSGPEVFKYAAYKCIYIFRTELGVACHINKMRACFRVFRVLQVIRVCQVKMEKQAYKGLLARQDRSGIEANEDFREKEDLWDSQDLWVREEKPGHKALMVSL